MIDTAAKETVSEMIRNTKSAASIYLKISTKSCKLRMILYNIYLHKLLDKLRVKSALLSIYGSSIDYIDSVQTGTESI